MTHDELIAARAGAAADGDLTLVRVCDEAIAARKSADDLGDALRRLGAGGSAILDVVAAREEHRARIGDDHDDDHHAGEELRVAAANMLAAAGDPVHMDDYRIRLVRAAALAIAEIERIDRAATTVSGEVVYRCRKGRWIFFRLRTGDGGRVEVCAFSEEVGEELYQRLRDIPIGVSMEVGGRWCPTAGGGRSIRFTSFTVSGGVHDEVPEVTRG